MSAIPAPALAPVTLGLEPRVTTDHDRYKWAVLWNTTIGMLVASLNSSILLISLPAIFRGIAINPLAPGQSGYLLWILLGYMVVTATLLVTFGRISDMFGRVKLYNLGFAIFTLGSLVLAFTPGSGDQAATFILVLRLVQGVGGAFLFANSTALLTDAFPASQRGTAMGVSQVAAIVGSLGGLLLGGWLSTIDWRLVFLVSVPFGLLGTIHGYLALHEVAQIKRGQRLDIAGNLTFGVGLTTVLIGLTYGIEPYGGSSTGWTNPFVIGCLVGGAALLAAFAWIELHVKDPLFHLELFKIRMFTAGNLSGFLASLARGGLQFMLILWLQGIWLPLHGYSFAETPLWAGIYTMPMLVGFVVSGPTSGWLSDRFGARAFATGGMLISAATFVALNLLPGDFNRWTFFALLLIMGIGMGLFAAPNTTSIMNSVPPEARGVASGMRGTFQNAGQMVSIAFFFSVLTAGLASSLPGVMYQGLHQHGLPAALSHQIAQLPPIGVLFAAFLGYNPMRSLVPPTAAAHLSAHTQSLIFGKAFFPHLILPAFLNGLHLAFYVSAGISLVAAVSSLLRGKRYIHGE
ncbi:MAG TPA: MFS transporter [Chloroflexota bacterium]|nr:MFS transporter [Chloroflexota bacterium]